MLLVFLVDRRLAHWRVYQHATDTLGPGVPEAFYRQIVDRLPPRALLLLDSYRGVEAVLAAGRVDGLCSLSRTSPFILVVVMNIQAEDFSILVKHYGRQEKCIIVLMGAAVCSAEDQQARAACIDGLHGHGRRCKEVF